MKTSQEYSNSNQEQSSDSDMGYARKKESIAGL